MPAVARRRMRARTEERSCGQAKPETCGATRDATEADCHSPAATRHEERSPKGPRERSVTKTKEHTAVNKSRYDSTTVRHERAGRGMAVALANPERTREDGRTTGVREGCSRARRRSNRRLPRMEHYDATGVVCGMSGYEEVAIFLPEWPRGLDARSGHPAPVQYVP